MSTSANLCGCRRLDDEKSLMPVKNLEQCGSCWVFRTRVPSKMPDSIEACYQVSLKTGKDPDGGPTGKMVSGKKFNHNVSSGADFVVQL